VDCPEPVHIVWPRAQLHVCTARWLACAWPSSRVSHLWTSRRSPRSRRSPEGCFESGLVVPGGRDAAAPWRDAAAPWRDAVRPWLEAVACELGRNQVP
jgi:hypothetical protein